MTDRPLAPELLDAMAQSLTDEVMPACVQSPQAQHSARVVAHLCRVIGRELRSAPSDQTVDTAVDLHDPAALDDPRVLSALLADAARRAEIARPGYALTAGAVPTPEPRTPATGASPT